MEAPMTAFGVRIGEYFTRGAGRELASASRPARKALWNEKEVCTTVCRPLLDYILLVQNISGGSMHKTSMHPTVKTQDRMLLSPIRYVEDRTVSYVCHIAWYTAGPRGGYPGGAQYRPVPASR